MEAYSASLAAYNAMCLTVAGWIGGWHQQMINLLHSLR